MAASWRDRSLRLIKEEKDKKKLRKVISNLKIAFIGASDELYFFLDRRRGFSIQKKVFSIKKLVLVTLRFRTKYPSVSPTLSKKGVKVV